MVSTNIGSGPVNYRIWQHDGTTRPYFGKQYDSRNVSVAIGVKFNEILSVDPKSVLEIGIGNGLVCHYLKQCRVSVRTVDTDRGLGPDRVRSVLDLPFPSNPFHVVACFQVLEHLPFKDISRALRELCRVTSSHVILSSPDW